MKKETYDGIQRRAMRVMECRAADADGNGYVVEGYAATFNEPYTLSERYGIRLREQIDRNAFDGCEMTDVIFQFDHEGRVYARTTNATLSLSTDEHGLFVRADLGGTEDGQKLYKDIKGGYITRMSFAFTVAGVEEKRTKDGDTVDYLQTVTKIKRLYDVSAVSIPANDGTEISARNALSAIVERERLSEEEARKKNMEELKAAGRDRSVRMLSL